MKLIDSETGYVYNDDIAWEDAIELSAKMGSMVKKINDNVYVRVYKRHNKFPEKVQHVVYHQSGMAERNKMKSIKISPKMLKKIIQEISEKDISEANQDKLRMLYNDTVRLIDKMNPQTSLEDTKAIRQMVLNIGNTDLELGEKLLAMFNKKEDSIEKVWSHVRLKTPIAKRKEVPMVTTRRPRREHIKIGIRELKEIIAEECGGQTGEGPTVNDILSSYVASLKALEIWAQSAHHLAKGDGFAGDHTELYGNLYTVLQDMFDATVEKIVGITNDETFGCGEKVTEESLIYLKQYESAANLASHTIAKTALEMIKNHVTLVAWVFDTLEQMGELTLGLNDFLATQASELETFVYLLQQRIKS